MTPVEETQLQRLQEHWPRVNFTLLQGHLPRYSRVAWMDGPTSQEVSEFLAIDPAAGLWNFVRNISCVARACRRGPLLPPSRETPWSSDQISEYLHQHGRDGYSDQDFYHFQDKNLEDLRTYAQDEKVLAQAEIAATLGEEAVGSDWYRFHLWLQHGGWARSGELLHPLTQT